MALLDLQNMDSADTKDAVGVESSLSLIGCISSVSFLICL